MLCSPACLATLPAIKSRVSLATGIPRLVSAGGAQRGAKDSREMLPVATAVGSPRADPASTHFGGRYSRRPPQAIRPSRRRHRPTHARRLVIVTNCVSRLFLIVRLDLGGRCDMFAEVWPHMWRVGLRDPEEYWLCSCGEQGTRRDPDDPHSWDALWHELAEHLVQSGQLSLNQAGSNAYAGYSGIEPKTNPLWAFRSDLSARDRRQARLGAGIPAPPGGQE